MAVNVWRRISVVRSSLATKSLWSARLVAPIMLAALAVSCGGSPKADPGAGTADWPADSAETHPRATGSGTAPSPTLPPATRMTPPPGSEVWLASCALDYESGLPTAVIVVTNRTQTAHEYNVEITFSSKDEPGRSGHGAARTGLLSPGAASDKIRIIWPGDEVTGDVGCAIGKVDRIEQS